MAFWIVLGFASGRAPLVATVEVGTTVECGPACALTFVPFGANATVMNESFVADLTGEYVTSNRRYRAIVLPERMGTSDALRFSDGFHRVGGLSASDSATFVWSAASCAANGAHGLTLAPSCAGLRTAQALSLASIFAEPLTLTLSGVVVPAAATLVATLGELVVNAASYAGQLVVTAEHAPACGDSASCNATDRYTIAISANAQNCSISVACGTDADAAESVWNGHGAAHGLRCRDELVDSQSGTPYDCGRGVLRLSSRGSSAVAIRSLALRSCLVPGHDPLRPGVAVPVYPAVLAGISDEIGWSSPDLGAAQSRADEGIVDVSAPPFGADRSGARDATRAIQSAVDYAREHYAVVYFPRGTYTVSDTIVLRSIPRIMATGFIPGPNPGGGTSDDFLLDGVSSRYVPNVLVGASRSEGGAAGEAQGATIVLAARTFTNASDPRYVLDFFFENSAGLPEPNAQYNSIAMDLTIVIGEGNLGAVGVRLRGAQGSGLEDVTVDVGDGLAGVVGGCGSGGAHHGLTIIGGRYGMDLRQSQPTATVSGTTLVGQRCAAIVYAGFESLSAVGINATEQRGCYAVVSTDSADAVFSTTGIQCLLPPMPTGPTFPGDYQASNAGIAGKISVVDSTIDFATDVWRERVCPNGAATAFSAVRSLYLQNVYVFNAENVYSVTTGGAGANATLLPSGGASALVERLVYAVDPPVDRSGFALRAAIYVNGTRRTGAHSLVQMSKSHHAPPSDLITRHRWLPGHPRFDHPDCVNAKSAGAKGNGVVDDYAAIQAALDAHACVYLPRGVYLTSETLQVHSGGAIVGVARHLTRITSMDSGLSFAAPRHANPLRNPDAAVRPVVEVLPAARGEPGRGTFVGFLSISVWNTLQNTSALHWHNSGTYRQVHCNRANRCGSLWRPGCANSTQINYPLQLIRGAAHVKLFTFYEGALFISFVCSILLFAHLFFCLRFTKRIAAMSTRRPCRNRSRGYRRTGPVFSQGRRARCTDICSWRRRRRSISTT